MQSIQALKHFFGLLFFRKEDVKKVPVNTLTLFLAVFFILIEGVIVFYVDPIELQGIIVFSFFSSIITIICVALVLMVLIWLVVKLFSKKKSFLKLLVIYGAVSVIELIMLLGLISPIMMKIVNILTLVWSSLLIIYLIKIYANINWGKTIGITAIVLAAFSLLIFLLTILSMILFMAINPDGAQSFMEKMVVAQSIAPSDHDFVEDHMIYLSAVNSSSPELRHKAINITVGCKNTECRISKIYNYMNNQFTYYGDAGGENHPQTPNETLAYAGGDCEDLSILTSSLLENVGVKTYLAFIEGHVFSIVCDIDKEDFQKAMVIDYLDNYVRTANEEGYEITLINGDAYETVKFSGKAIINEDNPLVFLPESGIERLSFDYDINASGPLNLWSLVSSTDVESFVGGGTYNFYIRCSEEGIISKKGMCNNMHKNTSVLLTSSTRDLIEVQYDITFKYLMVDGVEEAAEKLNITYYEFNQTVCVPLDITTNAYPGYISQINETIVAVSNRNHMDIMKILPVNETVT